MPTRTQVKRFALECSKTQLYKVIFRKAGFKRGSPRLAATTAGAFDLLRGRMIVEVKILPKRSR